ncbi:2-oxo-4-hydroxy-4-carboxy-5-ureidoimidazoline decarboxylase [Streptomyces sp. NPDC001698]|uniref:2-oxo-4-hydroxy-4-carboxy-5-ureidoimidazoline decarboxylase n=1 Tax=unclassified Streptomyces TaxID=2593676 RepID=UPI0036771CD0
MTANTDVHDLIVEGLDVLNRMDESQAADHLRETCGVNVAAWAARLASRRPFADVDSLVAAANEEVDRLTEEEVAESHRGLARIGAPKIGTDRETRWSSEESEGIVRTEQFLRELEAANEAYEARFGHIFLISATGFSGEEILRALRERTGNDRATETRIIKQELTKFLAVRMPKILHELAEPGPRR